jgi:hypothetical protein
MVCEGTMMTLSLAYVVLLQPTYTLHYILGSLSSLLLSSLPPLHQAAAVCPSPSDRRVQVCPPGSSLPRRPTGCRRRGARRPSASSPASAAPASSAAPWQPASSPSHPRFRSVVHRICIHDAHGSIGSDRSGKPSNRHRTYYCQVSAVAAVATAVYMKAFLQETDAGASVSSSSSSGSDEEAACRRPLCLPSSSSSEEAASLPRLPPLRKAPSLSEIAAALTSR